jgi:hypothetical protein
MATMSRRTFVGAGLAGAGSISWALPATAEEASPPLAVPSELLPGAVNAGASPLVRPGMRLIWLGAAATIPGERSQIVPDPNGTWVNRRTGQRYREFESPGPAGAGYTVGDVQSVAGNNVLSWLTRMLLRVDLGNATSFIDADGEISHVQNFGDFWMPPAQLAALTDRNESGVRTMRVPYPLGGRTYRAIRIQIDVGSGWAQNTYDLDTGVLLVGSSTGQGSPTVTLGPGNVITSGAGSTLMNFTQIAATRQTSLPGPGTTYPGAVAQLRALAYSGRRIIQVQGAGQAPPIPVQIRYDIVSNAGSYLTARMSVSNPTGVPDVRNRTFPAGVIGSLWMNPDLLGRYGANQTLDQDPVAGIQTTSLGRQGNLPSFALQTRLARQTFGYDLRNGLLTYAEHRQQNGPGTDILSVQLAGTQ